MKQKPILTGLAYLLELANPATREDYEAMVARIKPLVDVITAGHTAPDLGELADVFEREGEICRALDGDQAARVSLGMEKGE